MYELTWRHVDGEHARVHEVGIAHEVEREARGATAEVEHPSGARQRRRDQRLQLLPAEQPLVPVQGRGAHALGAGLRGVC